jgi:hypothetical protein
LEDRTALAAAALVEQLLGFADLAAGRRAAVMGASVTPA